MKSEWQEMELVLQGWLGLKRYFRLESVECLVLRGYPNGNAQEAFRLIREGVKLVVEI